MSTASARPLPLRHPTAAFLAGAASIYLLGALIVRALPGFDRPEPIAVAVAFDLTVTVTFLAWLLPVRSGRWSVAALVPLFLLSVAATSRVLPAAASGLLAPFRVAAVAAEAGLLTWIAFRIARVARRQAEPDPAFDALERIRRLAHELVDARIAADVLAFELSVLGYAFAPRRAAHAPAGSTVFGYAERSGYGAVVSAMALVVLAETIPLHVLLSRWNSSVAWIVTALGLYTLVYLFADWRAAHARPVLLDAETLLVRTGIRWTVRVPRERIAAVARRAPGDRGKPLRAVLFGGANLRIQLSEPVEAIGVYARRRMVDTIDLAVDEPDRLAAALALR